VTFEDKPDNLSISYPATWQRIGSSDPEVALVTGTAEVSLLMRTTRLGTKVGPKSLDSAKNLTDGLVMKGEHVKQLRPPRRIDNLGGLPGWLYIYSFQNTATGQRGAHAHYFLFRGDTLITLVFQTVPSERFANYAKLFDRLAGTFKATSSSKEPSKDTAYRSPCAAMRPSPACGRLAAQRRAVDSVGLVVIS